MPDVGPERRVRSARWAAALALAMVGVDVAALAVVVWTDALGLSLAVVYLFLTTFSAWILVSRRGHLRFAALPVVALGLLGLASFVLGHVGELVVLGLATAGFGAAAGHALHAGWARGAWTDVELRPVPAARRPVLIVNPASGDGAAERLGLMQAAAQRGLEVVVLRPGDDLAVLAARAVQGGADAIGMAGGDGSQAVIASVAARFGVAHVCVPAGTRNHFALDLGLDRTDVTGALDAFAEGFERSVDLAAVNGRVFVNNASLGVYAGVVRSKGYRAAKLRTWRRLLPDVLAPGGSPALAFDTPGDRSPRDVALLIVSNNAYRLTPFGGAGTRPRLDAGRLGVLAVRMRGAGAVARIVTLAALGRTGGQGDLRTWETDRFEVRSAAPVPVGLDGEALELASPLVFTSMPGALRVRLPSRYPSGAVHLTRRSMGWLALVGTGRLRREPTG